MEMVMEMERERRKRDSMRALVTLLIKALKPFMKMPPSQSHVNLVISQRPHL